MPKEMSYIKKGVTRVNGRVFVLITLIERTSVCHALLKNTLTPLCKPRARNKTEENTSTWCCVFLGYGTMSSDRHRCFSEM